jgi:hypothetical protein
VPKLMYSASLRPSLFKIRHRRNASAALRPIKIELIFQIVFYAHLHIEVVERNFLA